MGYAQRGTQVGESIVTILFYGFGLFVAHRYSTIGLRIVCIISCFVIFGGRKLHRTNTYHDDKIMGKNL
jgi:hypothetical protein